MNRKILTYKTDKKSDWIAIPIHKSQMLWLHKNNDYALVRFTCVDELKISGGRFIALYKYRYFADKTQKDIAGEGGVYENIPAPGKTTHIGSPRIKFGPFNILWSTMMQKDCCYIYVIPDEFDMRILPATEFEKYSYYPTAKDK